MHLRLVNTWEMQVCMLPSPQNEAVLKNISCYNHSYNGYYVNITSVQSQHKVRR